MFINKYSEIEFCFIDVYISTGIVCISFLLCTDFFNKTNKHDNFFVFDEKILLENKIRGEKYKCAHGK